VLRADFLEGTEAADDHGHRCRGSAPA
jgi:hypothetical protein